MDSEEEVITASVSILPPIDDWHQFSELKFHSVSSDLYNSQSCCICSYVRLSIFFLAVFSGGMVVWLSSACLSNLGLHIESMLELNSDWFVASV